MGRRRYVFDEARVQKFLAQQRGMGMGSSFRPWLKIQDVPSLGRSHRPFGIKTQRVHHFLSDGEWKCFLKFEADPTVIDIREQFPMDRLQTFQAARSLGYKHPVTLDGTPYVMTIDFLVTRREGSGVQIFPYTFKYSPDTLRAREKQLLDIASAFWRHQGHELQLIDETFFDEALVINYDLVRSHHDISNLDFFRSTNVAAIAADLRLRVRSRSTDLLQDACDLLAAKHLTTPQIVFAIALHLMARRTIVVNLSSPVGLERRRMGEFELAP